MIESSISVCFAFNGDADGLISQHLLELSGILPSFRVTGLKREIVLLEQLPRLKTASVYVFDISLDVNRSGLMNLLENPEVEVIWFDHHEAGAIPDSPRLKAHILNARGTCTALIVHTEFPGLDPRWAAMAAFGDNLPEAGEALLRPLNISGAESTVLREAGELLNYNAYGETVEDVLFHPLEIAKRLSRFNDPLLFIRESGFFEPLREQLHKDESNLNAIVPEEEKANAKIYRLPCESWARRMGAIFANRFALKNPDCAIGVLHLLSNGDYQVSIRSPRNDRAGVFAPASDLAREFPTGGGRALAAGINRLPSEAVSNFKKRFFELYAP